MTATRRELVEVYDEDNNAYEVVDEAARGDISSLSSRVSTLENATPPSDGKSAYEIYVDNVPSGTSPMTEQQWLASLNGTSVVVTPTQNGCTISDGSHTATITNGQDGTNGTNGSDGASVSVKSSTKSNGVTTVVLTDGTTDSTLTINDGTTPTITPNSGNTVTEVSGVYTLTPNAQSHIYRLDVSYGSGDNRNFTTPNLLFGTDAILDAIDAIINETPTVTES